MKQIRLALPYVFLFFLTALVLDLANPFFDKPARDGGFFLYAGQQIADGKISLQGSVINLRDTDIKVPSIMATIVDQDEKPIEQLLIAPPVANIKAEGQASFDAIYPNVPDGASNVTFAFSFLSAGPPIPQKEETAPPEKVGETPEQSATEEHH